MGTCDSLLYLSAGDASNRIYGQRSRGHARSVAQEREEPQPLNERQSSQQTAVSVFAQKDWEMPPITWQQAVNQFVILFGERFTAAIS
ncbi:hypothetical protein QZM86_12475 [Burkholderia vietnamiensis]|nr:hypothetical protein [Burkholderia vietnamiensis]MDN7926098.1 hypothetical protein [Burkholderia vietnamiensis]